MKDNALLKANRNKILLVKLPSGSFGMESGMLLHQFVSHLKGYNTLIVDFKRITSVDTNGISFAMKVFRLCCHKKIAFIVSSYNERMNPYFKKVLDHHLISIRPKFFNVIQTMLNTISPRECILSQINSIESEFDKAMVDKSRLLRRMKHSIRVYEQNKMPVKKITALKSELVSSSLML